MMKLKLFPIIGLLLVGAVILLLITRSSNTDTKHNLYTGCLVLGGKANYGYGDVDSLTVSKLQGAGMYNNEKNPEYIFGIDIQESNVIGRKYDIDIYLAKRDSLVGADQFLQSQSYWIYERTWEKSIPISDGKEYETLPIIEWQIDKFIVEYMRANEDACG